LRRRKSRFTNAQCAESVTEEVTMANCPVHNVEFKFIPPGVSKKTGKPYQGFFACPEYGCREKPQNAPTAPQIEGQVSSVTPAQKTPPASTQHVETTVSQGIALLHGKMKDIDSRLDGVEANQQRIIKGIAMVLEAVKEERLTDGEVDRAAEEID